MFQSVVGILILASAVAAQRPPGRCPEDYGVQTYPNEAACDRFYKVREGGVKDQFYGSKIDQGGKIFFDISLPQHKSGGGSDIRYYRLPAGILTPQPTTIYREVAKKALEIWFFYVALFQYSVDLGPGEVPQYEKNCSSKPSPTLFLHDYICIRVFNSGGCCATLFQVHRPQQLRQLNCFLRSVTTCHSFRPSVLPVSFAREQ